jgi:hypothetical protein
MAESSENLFAPGKGGLLGTLGKGGSSGNPFAADRVE